MKEQREKSLEELILSLPSGITPEGVIRHRARVEYEQMVADLAEWKRAAEHWHAEWCAWWQTFAQGPKQSEE